MKCQFHLSYVDEIEVFTYFLMFTFMSKCFPESLWRAKVLFNTKFKNNTKLKKK